MDLWMALEATFPKQTAPRLHSNHCNGAARQHYGYNKAFNDHPSDQRVSELLSKYSNDDLLWYHFVMLGGLLLFFWTTQCVVQCFYFKVFFALLQACKYGTLYRASVMWSDVSQLDFYLLLLVSKFCPILCSTCQFQGFS